MGRRVVLIRDINIGGKNPVPMAGLRGCLEELGCSGVTTHLASGNALVDSAVPVKQLTSSIEQELPRRFKLHDEAIKVLVLSAARFHAIIDGRPKGFGDQPTVYYSDAIFLMGLRVKDVMAILEPREGVDTAWPGDGVIYWQRLTAQRTRTRLSKLMSHPEYKSMTTRSWSTTIKLAELLDAPAEERAAGTRRGTRQRITS
jgi:uncharacterized protein (DUF1697 family)